MESGTCFEGLKKHTRITMPFKGVSHKILQGGPPTSYKGD